MNWLSLDKSFNIAEAVENLRQCIESKEYENAYQWCHEILFCLYQREVIDRVKAEDTIAKGVSSHAV